MLLLFWGSLYTAHSRVEAMKEAVCAWAGTSSFSPLSRPVHSLPSSLIGLYDLIICLDLK